ncbi:uncharacterized protein LOC133416794 isoform X2 [Phycodurus eques]|uniref:uncharacterized protein LOC133416794 isoform X2 n=1 Tax=Phycodurus eques TaxID=693459 RepID=UPI002ACE6EF0|nr:uncharacterized protein LOC133416794 isoform X2 [Phycodurus eques]XP_061559981.1 uncharacterized protein LOC133416794 isoform X2 [Phycodurus eques]
MTSRQGVLTHGDIKLSAVISGQHTYVFARAGDVAILPCKRSSCSGLGWSYSRDRSPFVREVENGRVLTTSARSQRLSLKDDCSLLVGQVEAEDSGFFTCVQKGQPELNVFLTVMTLTSSSPRDSDSMGEGHVILKCSLACWPGIRCSCRQRRFRWMDAEGQELYPEGTQQKNCVSFFKVLPVCRNRNYACQYVCRDDVKVQAHYTAVFQEVNTRGPGGRTRLINIIQVAVAVSLVIVFVLAVVHIQTKLRRNTAQDTTGS